MARKRKKKEKPLFRLTPSHDEFRRMLGLAGMNGFEGEYSVMMEASFAFPAGRDIDLDAPGAESKAGYKVSEPLKGAVYDSLDGLAMALTRLFPGTGIGEKGQWACFIDEQSLDGLLVIEGWTRDGNDPHLVYVKAPGRDRVNMLDELTESECIKALYRGEGGRHWEIDVDDEDDLGIPALEALARALAEASVKDAGNKNT